MYCIVNKITCVDNKLVYTPVGYIDNNVSLCNQINLDYDNTLGNWIETNKTDLENSQKSISEYFVSDPIIHVAKTETTNIEGLELIEITDLNQLI